jgi:hypothetical protein
MTRDQHRQIGAILGFPSCCVEAWVENLSSPEPLANLTGSVDERDRPRLEALACHVGASSVLGRPWGLISDCPESPDDLRKHWVPCVPCAERYGSLGGRRVTLARTPATCLT